MATTAAGSFLLSSAPAATAAVDRLPVAARVTGGASAAAPANAFSAQAAAKPVTKSKSVERFYVDASGRKTVVDKRTVHVTLSTTKDLRSLQQINVTWSGAHVTDGVELDQNSNLAANEEYSFDLFECRGLDSTKVPVTDRISPSTCWTQFADERFKQSYDDGPAWQSDYFASTAERQNIVDAPAASGLPFVCKNLLLGVQTQRWVPFRAPDKTYYGGPDGCAGLPPEGAPENLSNLSLPSNETYGVTAADGKGSAKFDVFTAQDHASLACSQQVPCSLVAIPIEGVSCDPYGTHLPVGQRPTSDEAADAKTNCETDGYFTPGELLNNVEQSGADAVDGRLWWSASNWRNRISFPLTFAPPDNVCTLVGGNQVSASLFGTELMQQAMLSWAPKFCLAKGSAQFTPKLVESSEPEARQLLASNEANPQLSQDSVETAVGTIPPSMPYPRPTVQAPIAVSGFGVAFAVDDPNHNQVLHLNLDARLIAKLLTESYPTNIAVKDSYPVVDGVATLSNNPLNITHDPEFQALNPGVGIHDPDAASALLVQSLNSDAMTALTTYINDDPAARAWLNGQPDPWGMRVNPNYRGIKLPVERWPLLDSFEPTSIYKLGLNDCLYADPVPFLPLIQNPQSSLYQIALDADFAIAQPQTTCVLPSPIPGDLSGAKLVANGREAPGYRFMLSVVSLADAARFNLRLASLRTASTVSPGTKFTSAAGQTFVAPTPGSLKAAADVASFDRTAKAFVIPPDKLAKTPTAYPGTMLLNAAVPTSGLDRTLASNVGNLLRFAAGSGQVQGSASGDLPAGYLPMTKANGLASLASYTQRAATTVAAQKGRLPSLTPGTPTTKGGGPNGPGPGPGGTGGNPASNGTGPAGANGNSIGPAGTNTGPGGNSSGPSAAPTSSGTPPGRKPGSSPAALATTPDVTGGASSWLLPAMLITLLVTAGGVLGLRFYAGRGGR